MTCVPAYIEPERVRQAALEELDALESLASHQWADGSYFFLEQDGRFRHTMRDERSWQVCIFLATVSIQSLFSPRDRLIPREHLRLTATRHDLLIAILVHSLLWTRDRVVDAFGRELRLSAGGSCLPTPSCSLWIRSVTRTGGTATSRCETFSRRSLWGLWIKMCPVGSRQMWRW